MVETLFVVGAAMVFVLFLAWIPFSAYVHVEPGTALIVNKHSAVNVYFTTAVVLPVLHGSERMDISLKTLTIVRRGKDGVVCGDKLRADISARFTIRVNRTPSDVLRVAESVGCARAGDSAALEELFSATFIDAIETVAAQLDFEELSLQRQEFCERVVQVIGEDLHGFVLEDLSLDDLEQTPIEQLDPGNILDATGIKKIVEITERRALERHQLEADARKRRLEIDAGVADLERVKTDALARLRADTGGTLTESDLRERIAALIVEHYGPRIDLQQARALVESDAAPPT
ncbi:MAG: SPFH domain-containing protein [Nannocystaceae bacterium]|nr:SPFH domain-containing protein [bacterium]